MTQQTDTLNITDEHRRKFQDEGYFILDRAIPPHHLENLRSELGRFIEDIHAEMDRLGEDTLGLNHRGKRYFIGGKHRESEKLADFVYSDMMADICRATIGDNAFFFLEQYVVKAAEVGLKFSWHQDSGYLKSQIPDYVTPYLTCWCALDDMTEQNGTIYILPYSRAPEGKKIIDHVKDEELNDMVGYFGDDPGDPVIVPAGSIAVFSTAVFHRSGANQTDRPRRSYVVQYSPEPILKSDGTPQIFAIPFLENRRRVR